MNCAKCGKPLQRHEEAEPMIVMGHKAWPKSVCDACCKANLTQPGAGEALERLVSGEMTPPLARTGDNDGKSPDETAQQSQATMEGVL